VRPPDTRGDGAWNFVKLIDNNEVGWRGGRVQAAEPVVKSGLEEWVARYVGEPNKEKR